MPVSDGLLQTVRQLKAQRLQHFGLQLGNPTLEAPHPRHGRRTLLAPERRHVQVAVVVVHALSDTHHVDADRKTKRVIQPYLELLKKLRQNSLRRFLWEGEYPGCHVFSAP